MAIKFSRSASPLMEGLMTYIITYVYFNIIFGL